MSQKVPSYRRHSLRNVAFYQYAGKRYYLPGAYGSAESWGAYRQAIKELLGIDNNDGVKTVGDLVIEFLDWAESSYPNPKRGEYQVLRWACGEFTKHCLAISLDRVKPAHVIDARDCAVKRGVSRQSANKMAGKIVRMFKWGCSNGYVSGETVAMLRCIEPLKKGRTAAREAVARQPVAWRDVRLTIKEMPTETLRNMVRLQWLTGVRPSNICDMRSCDITQQRDCYAWTPEKHKNDWRGKTLVVFIGPRAWKIIQNQRSISGEASKFLFTSKTGEPYKEQSYAQAIARTIERINKINEDAGSKAMVSHWTPYQIRHARATRIQERYGIEAARVFLGVSSIDTAQIYAHESGKKALLISKKIG